MSATELEKQLIAQLCKAEARVAELEAEVSILRELEEPAKDAAEILLDFHDINPPRVVIKKILDRLAALRTGRGEAVRPSAPEGDARKWGE